jgi:hypothetical protein
MKTSKRLYLIAFIALLLVACELPPTITPTPLDQETPTLDPQTPVFTPTLSVKTPTKTPVDLATPTLDQETPTLTPSPSDTPPPTETATSSPTPYDPTPTQIVTFKTLTPTPPATATDVPSITPSHTPDIWIGTEEPIFLENLLPNPDLEEFYWSNVCRDGECVVHYVPVGYEPFYCDEPYMPEKCDAYFQGTKNPIDLKMRRPEWKIAKKTEYPNRVYSGDFASQWFTFSGVHQGGLYTVVDTEPGWLCEAGGMFQSMNNIEGDIDSEARTEDERANVSYRIQVNKSGKTFFKSEDNLSSRWYGYDDFPYDTWGLVSYQFTTNSTQTTVFFESLVLFPVTNSDVYLDSVYMRCATP